MAESAAGAPLAEAPPRAAESQRRVAWAIPAFVFLAIVLVLFALAPKGTGLDYAVFHRAGARYWSGESLYRGTEFFAYKYAPIAAAFFAPLSLLPERLGWLCTNLMSALVLFLVLRWALRRVGAAPWRLEIALVLAMTAPYYGHLFWLGQTDGLVLGLLVASEAWAERRPWLSGVLWALACLVKPPFLCLLLIVALLRQWRRLGGLVVGVPLWLVAGAIRGGWTGGRAELIAWASTLTRSTLDIICWEFNQSVFALACTYGGGHPGTLRFNLVVAALASIVTLAGTVIVLIVRRADRARGGFVLFAFALYLGAFLSPLGWNTNLLSALPLACVLAHVAVAGPDRGLRRAAWIAAMVVVGMNVADLLLLPFHPWEDTVQMLFWLRQYAIAGLVLLGATLGVTLATVRRARLDTRGVTA